jgi:hypothetical protein
MQEDGKESRANIYTHGFMYPGNVLSPQAVTAFLQYNQRSENKEDMCNGRRKLLDVPIHTPDLNDYVQAFQMRMKAELREELGAHCVVASMQILDGVDDENQLPHADHFADCLGVVILLEGDDLTEMCDIPWIRQYIYG